MSGYAAVRMTCNSLLSRQSESLRLNFAAMDAMDYTAMIKENDRRRQRLATERYDPLTGEGCCGERREVRVPGGGRACVPASMLLDPEYSDTLSLNGFEMLRMRHDFEFWCAKCVAVKDKTGWRDIRLVLNRPQRIILRELEAMRTARRPIRAIVLKARQCGVSTLIQAYMAWIQITQRDNWHSLVCAHVRDAAATIRAMMSKLLVRYPEEYLPDGKELRLRPFEGSRNICRIDGRQNTIAVCSAENQEAARGSDLAMAHLSEVAFWRETPGHDPNAIIRSIAGSVALAELTLVVMESTANGVGNFFHTEWLRAKAGESDKVPVFVPWYEYGIYSVPVDDYHGLIDNMDSYERGLWESGLTLEQIAWYHSKRREYASHKAMKAEYPTTDIESNTLEAEAAGAGNAAYILDEIADYYPNIYCRNVIDRLTGTRLSQVGFHTNRATKPLVVNHHIATVRDGRYVERDMEAVNEHATYERRNNGGYAAKEGCHDDILMTRCIGLYIADDLARDEPPDLTPLKIPPVRYG